MRPVAQVANGRRQNSWSRENELSASPATHCENLHVSSSRYSASTIPAYCGDASGTSASSSSGGKMSASESCTCASPRPNRRARTSPAAPRSSCSFSESPPTSSATIGERARAVRAARRSATSTAFPRNRRSAESLRLPPAVARTASCTVQNDATSALQKTPASACSSATTLIASHSAIFASIAVACGSAGANRSSGVSPSMQRTIACS